MEKWQNFDKQRLVSVVKRGDIERPCPRHEFVEMDLQFGLALAEEGRVGPQLNPKAGTNRG